MPFTLRDFPKDMKSLKVNNDFACLPKLLRFPTKDGARVDIFASDELFRETFFSKLREINGDIRSVKSKFMALGWYFMMKYFIFLLRVPMNNHPWTVADTYTSVVSIVPGKREPYVFDCANKDRAEIEVRSLVYFVPGQGRLANGVSVITHGKHLQLGVMADSTYWTGGQDHN